MIAGAGIDPAFYPAAWSVGKALGLYPWRAGYDVASILFSESSIWPTAQNSIGCVGINQMCPGTLTVAPATYISLSASQQLQQYAYPLWLGRVHRYGSIASARDLYWLNYYPATYKPRSSSSTVVNPNTGGGDAALSQGKRYVTAGDLESFLNLRCQGARWNAIHANLAPYATWNPFKVAGTAAALGAIGYAGWYLWR
jgi:hypothetical protein